MIDQNLATKFAEVFLEKPKELTKRTNAYGVVEIVDGEKRVRLDGSQYQTPVVEGISAKNGDRVIVSLISHTLSITGNLSKGEE